MSVPWTKAVSAEVFGLFSLSFLNLRAGQSRRLLKKQQQSPMSPRLALFKHQFLTGEPLAFTYSFQAEFRRSLLPPGPHFVQKLSSGSIGAQDLTLLARWTSQWRPPGPVLSKNLCSGSIVAHILTPSARRVNQWRPPDSKGRGNEVHKRMFQRNVAAGAVNRAAPLKKKAKIVYVCSECGEDFPQWHGKCSNCGAWSTLKEFRAEPAVKAGASGGGGGGAAARAVAGLDVAGAKGGSRGASSSTSEDSFTRRGRGAWLSDDSNRPLRLSEVEDEYLNGKDRLALPGDTGAEMARVLGGGVKKGSLILVGGDPGVGKSTLLLQVANMLAEGSLEDGSAPVLYISGEESVSQVRGRAARMGLSANDLFLYSATSMEAILEWIVKIRPRAVIVDSIQTVYLEEATGSAGSVSQVRECSSALLHAAKRLGVTIFLVGHVTKTGDIAGPRVLEHIVDVVLYMEGERLQSHRLLRGVKNRYGPTDEIGVFEMVQEGLKAVPNPSEVFLSERLGAEPNATAAAVAVTLEGTRPMLLEIQALCSEVAEGPARRSATGVDLNRLHLLMAVLSKQAGLKLGKQDVYVNVVGGVRLQEPAADLALAMAVSSSFYDKPIPRDMAFIGEIGLGGELRSVHQIDSRLKEAAKLGFKTCIVPSSAGKSIRLPPGRIGVIQCSTVKDAIKAALA